MSGLGSKRLPGVRPLRIVLPDIDWLLADPAKFLAREPVSIATVRPYLALAILAALMVGVGSYFLYQHNAPGYFYGIIGLAAIGLACKMWPTPQEMILGSNGVELRRGNTMVWCPWGLFVAQGSPFLNKHDILHTELTIPIAPAAVAQVEMRRKGAVLARGRAVAGDQFRFLSDHEAVLTGCYEVVAEELANLLLQLGPILSQGASSPPPTEKENSIQESPAPRLDSDGRPIPVSWAPPSAQSGKLEPDEQPARLDDSGWLVVSLTRLHFPPNCCVCGRPTVAYYEWTADVGAFWLNLFSQGLAGNKELEFTLPFCPACWRAYRRHEWLMLAVRVLVYLMPLGVIVAIAYASLDVCLGCWLFVLAFPLMYLFEVSQRYPLKVKFYAGRRQAAMRFYNREYGRTVLEYLRSLE